MGITTTKSALNDPNKLLQIIFHAPVTGPDIYMYIDLITLRLLFIDNKMAACSLKI